MAQIAVTILDPNDNRSAHLVETRLPTREVILPIVARLKLPERASYQLFPLGSERPLPADKTFAENGVPAGAELQLKPIRNQVLKTILDKLYEEAQGYIEEQAWEMAKEKLEELLRLDPAYPDPLGLEKAVMTQTSSLRSGARMEGATQQSKATPSGRTAQSTRTPQSTRGTRFGKTPSGTPAATPPQSPSNSAYQLSPQAAKSSGASCVGITLMIVGVVVAGGIALTGAAFFLPGIFDDLVARIGLTVPNTVVLGTGDVQVTLRWQGDADLDLHVIDPAGEEIWFGNAQSASGGILDVDANGACDGLAQPVENIYWPTGAAPNGPYSVTVVYYQACGSSAPVDYEVTITLDGDVFDVINAQMTSEGERHPVSNFEY